MKTLDEVITIMDHVEFCCTNCKLQFDCDEVECFLEDALHYLKEYREEDKKLGAAINEACDVEMKYCRLVEELERNEPLTWDELRQMAGKPVWVETKYYSSRWAVITDVDDVRIGFVGKQLLDSEIVQEMGESWQAYRKER